MPQEKPKKIWLSPTGLGNSKRCPRCFWLRYHKKIYQPEGIVSRLANRFDGVIKRYFDLYRPAGELPPMIEGQVEGKLQHPFQETYFYSYNEKYGFLGKLDECLITDKGKYTPIDHKTSSSDPNVKPMIPAYQTQLDSYAFLLDKNNRPSSGIGHLIYFYPSEGKNLHQGFPMEITVKTLKTNPRSAFTELLKAIKILEGKMPKSSKDCPFCNWHSDMKKLAK
ncbi:PD-(D/E)XK nuclease family protein [Patescibacteria group bacterium]|nr:PD-(D/E)XK nuclease family protein [Patescibacteria group bacterium]MBU0964604.1 PD-(D/E)XK nuclease family protein [Patescibacteria group bacterium]